MVQALLEAPPVSQSRLVDDEFELDLRITASPRSTWKIYAGYLSDTPASCNGSCASDCYSVSTCVYACTDSGHYSCEC